MSNRLIPYNVARIDIDAIRGLPGRFLPWGIDRVRQRILTESAIHLESFGLTTMFPIRGCFVGQEAFMDITAPDCFWWDLKARLTSDPNARI